MIKQKDIKNLEKIINKTDVVEGREYINQLHENESYYFGMDQYRAGLLIKNTEDVEKVKFNRDVQNIVTLVENTCTDRDNNEIKFDRKDMIKNLKTLWIKFKIKASEEHKIFAHDYSTMIVIKFLKDENRIEYKLQGVNDLYIISDTEEVSYEYNIPYYSEENLEIGINLKYFLDGLNLMTDGEVVMKYLGRVSPLGFVQEDRMYMMLPIRILK